MIGWIQKRRTIQHYNQSAKVYENQYCEEQEAKIKTALKGFTLERGSIALDVGCGTGMLFSFIADRVKLVVGIDLSTSIIKKAKKRVNENDTVALIRADADFMPFLSESFDSVFAITLIQNTPRHSRTLGEMKRVTKKNSIIVITGLKKAFSQSKFTRLLRETELEIKSLNVNEKLRDYVAVCLKSERQHLKEP